MPYEGEIKKGEEIGKIKGLQNTRKYVWRVCISCGEGSWQHLVKGRPQRETCWECHVKKHIPLRLDEHGCWKGGRLTREGYVLLRLENDSPYLPMADSKGYIKEHRLVMAKKVGRLLLKTELVHHRDGNRSNNNGDNLELISWANHTLYKQMCSDCPLRKQIRQLQKTIKMMQPELTDDGA